MEKISKIPECKVSPCQSVPKKKIAPSANETKAYASI